MKMKKMLAVLAAISMLASMGISAAAEDEAVTTTVTTAEETVTTTATETTAATEATTATETTTATEETTAETTTSSETEITVATEENETVKEVLEDGTIVYGTKTYKMGGNGDGTPHYHEVKVVLYDTGDVIERLSVYVDGTLSNLSGIAVGSAIAGDEAAHDYRDNPDNFFATFPPLDEIAITSYGIATYYYYDDISGQFVEVGETVTTTTTTTSTTTTTTTVTSGETVTEGMLYQIFEEYVAEKKAEYKYTGDIRTFIYVPEKQLAYGVYGWNGSDCSDEMCIITKDGVVEQEHSGVSHSSIFRSSYFTCNGIPFVATLVDLYTNGGSLIAVKIYNMGSGIPVETNLTGIKVGNVIEPHGYPITDPESSRELSAYFSTLDDNTISLNGIAYNYDINSQKFVEVDNEQEKTFTVEIPTSYVTAVCGITGEPITESNYKNSMVVSVTDITGCTNGKASIVSNGSFVAGFTVKDAKPGTITITGTTGTFSSHEDPSINTSHGQCGAAGNPDTFTVTVTIDENGNIVTGGSNNGGSSNDGKTDSGSTTSNKPSTNNTTGTPKTGDVATLPAVALGLTMTAAGIAAIIYKKRK